MNPEKTLIKTVEFTFVMMDDDEVPRCNEDEALLCLLTDWTARFIHLSTGIITFHPDVYRVIILGRAHYNATINLVFQASF